MANIIITPLMSLPNPVPVADPGPDYASNIQSCFNILDQHNHSPGSGQQVNPDGLNINADLAFGGNNATNFRSVRFAPQLVALSAPTDIGCLYESGVDLYYNDGLGNQVRITQSGNVTGASGTITGLPSGTASASYAAGVFTFQAATLTAANLDAGSVVLRNNTASSFGLTLSPPNAMGADYQITLPTLPASTLPISITSSGTEVAQPITFAQLDSALQAKIITPPTVQKFLTGAGTYTTPVSPSPLYLKVTMVGGGGAGSAANQSGTGGDGGNTTFGTTFLVANGGTGAPGSSNPGGVGGTVTIPAGAIQIKAVIGADGSVTTQAANFPGAIGASTPLGGAGCATQSVGGSAKANTGSAGAGGGGSGVPGASGGAGGYLEAFITSSIASTYSYSVGVGGSPFASSDPNGGSGAAGVIIVEEYYT